MSGVDKALAFAFVLALMPIIAAGMLVVNLAVACLTTVTDVIAVFGVAMGNDEW